MPTSISISLGLTSVWRRRASGGGSSFYILGADTARLLGADGALLTFQ
jgi:hypothetical protein